MRRLGIEINRHLILSTGKSVHLTDSLLSTIDYFNGKTMSPC